MPLLTSVSIDLPYQPTFSVPYCVIISPVICPCAAHCPLLGWCAACQIISLWPLPIFNFFSQVYALLPLKSIEVPISRVLSEYLVQACCAPTLRFNQAFHFQLDELFFLCFTFHDVKPVLSPSLLFYFSYTSPWLLYVPAVWNNVYFVAPPEYFQCIFFSD